MDSTIISIIVSVVLALVGWIGFTDQGNKIVRRIFSRRPQIPSPEVWRALQTNAISRVEGDHSIFIRDVTIPDGTKVKVGQKFFKVWEIQNGGSVSWKGRFLMREGPHDDPRRLRSPQRVPIPVTHPGQRCQIEVEIEAPVEPASQYAEWKMVDEHGRYCFPNLTGIWLSVDVVE